MAKIKEGAFIEIVLPNKKFTYGRILGKACYAFYDLYSDDKISDIESIKNAKILFVLAVHNDAIKKNRWKIIGIAEIEKEIRKIPLAFIQDELNPSQFDVYDPNTGDIRKATKEECTGLERAAVWDPEHVEDRITDHFEKRSNRWVESLKIKST